MEELSLDLSFLIELGPQMFTPHNNVMFPVYVESSKQNRQNIPVLHMVILVPLPHVVSPLLMACWLLLAPTLPVVQSEAPLWQRAMRLYANVRKKASERDFEWG